MSLENVTKENNNQINAFPSFPQLKTDADSVLHDTTLLTHDPFLPDHKHLHKIDSELEEFRFAEVKVSPLTLKKRKKQFRTRFLKKPKT